VTHLDDGAMRAIAGPDMTVLRTPVHLRGDNFKSVARFVVSEGETVPFVLSYGRSYRDSPPGPSDPIVALKDTEKFWRDWAAGCRETGKWSGAVRRSLITLKALAYRPTGGIVAAPTTSLPEQLGGARNWDYRYCWLRDATFTLLSLMNSGYYQSAREHPRRHLPQCVQRDGRSLHPVLRCHDAGRERPADAARRLSACNRPSRGRYRYRDRARSDGGRPCHALRHEKRQGRAGTR
jgi:hypothetical protein